MTSVEKAINQKLTELGISHRQVFALVLAGFMVPLAVRAMCGKDLAALVALLCQFVAFIVAACSVAFTWVPRRAGKAAVLAAIFSFFVVCGSFVATA